MNEGLHTMDITLPGYCEPEMVAHQTYLAPLFGAVRQCLTAVRVSAPGSGETTFRLTVAVLRPDTYARLLAAERELHDLKRVGGSYDELA